MSHLKKQENFNFTYSKDLFYLFSRLLLEIHSSNLFWLNGYLLLKQRMFIFRYLSVLSFLFFILSLSSILSKLWFWMINSLGVVLLVSYWLLAKWGSGLNEFSSNSGNTT